MSRPPFDPRKELDEVVGRYRPREHETLVRRVGWILAKALAGASFAIAAMLLVMWVLDRHVRKAQTAPGPKKPVPVHIVPAR